jgi:hypothetical protein
LDVQASQLSASSTYGTGCCPAANGYLDFDAGESWCASPASEFSSWLQVDLGSFFNVDAVGSKGNPGYAEGAATFEVHVSTDGDSYTNVGSFSQSEVNFNVETTHSFDTVAARYVRFYPTTKYGDAVCLRVEVDGTAASPTTAAPSTSPTTAAPTTSPTTSAPTPSPTEANPPDVTLEFTASGNVADYGASELATVQTNVATAAGVPTSAVGVAVAAASVRFFVTITTTSTAQATSISNTLTTSLSSAAAATSVLGVPVTATPSVAVDGGGVGGGGGGGGSGGGVSVGVIAGAAGGGAALLIVVALLFYCQRSKKVTGESTSTKQAPPMVPKVSETLSEV